MAAREMDTQSSDRLKSEQSDRQEQREEQTKEKVPSDLYVCITNTSSIVLAQTRPLPQFYRYDILAVSRYIAHYVGIKF